MLSLSLISMLDLNKLWDSRIHIRHLYITYYLRVFLQKNMHTQNSYPIKRPIAKTWQHNTYFVPYMKVKKLKKLN